MLCIISKVGPTRAIRGGESCDLPVIIAGVFVPGLLDGVFEPQGQGRVIGVCLDEGLGRSQIIATERRWARHVGL